MMSNAFWKLLTLVVALALIGLTLVVLRQQRYLVAAELTRTHAEFQAAERRVWELQTQLAQRMTPKHLHDLAVRHELTEPRELPAGARRLTGLTPDRPEGVDEELPNAARSFPAARLDQRSDHDD
jgi:hypothetical protein